MPFTPFHFGPGLFGKSLVSGYFSWTAFIVSQVIIDCETLYYLIQGTYPIHRFFHTFLGATLAGLATGVGLIVAKLAFLRMKPKLRYSTSGLRPSLQSELSNVGLLVGGLVGGLSHPFLDGIMHPDVRPFAPWTNANPFLRFISLESLHLGCLFLGLIGFVLMAIRLSHEEAG